MQFDGTVHIQAACADVWQLLVDPDQLAQMMPLVDSAEIIIPNKRFAVEVGTIFGRQRIALPVEIEWENVQSCQLLQMRGTSSWSNQPIELVAEMNMDQSDAGMTEIWFSAEFTRLPNALPKPLVHTLAHQHIRTFFVNLKNSAESAS